MMIPNN